MTHEDVLKEAVVNLEKLNIPYALTGGIAVSYYGDPRSTHDFDLIIQVTAGHGNVKNLLLTFEKGFYISEEGVIDAILHRTMFNIIHHETSFKIDLWILKEDEYDKEAFARRRKVNALGMDVFILTAEDMILNKLQWYKVSEIDKHLDDVRGIYKIQKDNLDGNYLKKWALKLSVNSLLDQIALNDLQIRNPQEV